VRSLRETRIGSTQEMKPTPITNHTPTRRGQIRGARWGKIKLTFPSEAIAANQEARALILGQFTPTGSDADILEAPVFEVSGQLFVGVLSIGGL